MSLISVTALAVALACTFFTIVHFLGTVSTIVRGKISVSIGVVIVRCLVEAVPLAVAIWLYDTYLR